MAAVVAAAAAAAAAAASGAPPPGIVETRSVDKVKHDDGTKSINGYVVREELGSGSFAKVKLCEEESSAEQFAMKVFRKGRLRRQRDFVGGSDGSGMKIRTSMDKVYSEVAVMKKVSHPNCIRLYAIFDEPALDAKLYLVIEYAANGCVMDWDGERCTYCVPGTGDLVPEAQARLYMYDVLHGLGYLHDIRVAHRDIKPQNLLLTAEDIVKIGDFGVAIDMEEDMMVQGTEGTYYFFSPEMCRSGYNGHDGRRADVWAVGVTAWAFVFGSVPFFRSDLANLLESIAEARWAFPASPSISEDGRDFISKALSPLPEERPLCPALLSHAWHPAAPDGAAHPPRCTAARATAQMC